MFFFSTMRKFVIVLTKDRSVMDETTDSPDKNKKDDL